MRRIVMGGLAALLAVGLAACATGPEGTGKPCEKCSYGYVTVKKTPERHAFCMVNGTQVDCTKNPAECPSCK